MQKGAVLAGAVVLLVLVATVLLLLLPSGRQSRTPVARPTRELAKNYPFERGTCPAAINATQISVASHDSPRIFVYRNFMTAEEADYVIKYGEAVGLRRSEVATKDANSLSEVRTSTGTFLSSKGDPVLEAIEARIAAWAQVPVENGEAFYLLRYEEGQQYKPHYDFFDVSSLSSRSPLSSPLLTRVHSRTCRAWTTSSARQATGLRRYSFTSMHRTRAAQRCSPRRRSWCPPSGSLRCSSGA